MQAIAAAAMDKSGLLAYAEQTEDSSGLALTTSYTSPQCEMVALCSQYSVHCSAPSSRSMAWATCMDTRARSVSQLLLVHALSMKALMRHLPVCCESRDADQWTAGTCSPWAF